MVSSAVHQSRRAVVVLMAVLLGLGWPQIGAQDVAAQPAEAYALVDAVNVYRESLGLPPLAVSGALMVAAQRHVEWMAATYTYSHTGEGGTSPQDRARAAGFSGMVRENVGGSTNGTPGEMVFFWDLSYGHQVTLRMAQATSIGCGFAANSQQRLFVLLVGTLPGQAPQAASAPIAGGTPAIDFTPPPGMVWSTNGELHTSAGYDPVAPGQVSSSGVSSGEAGPPPTEAAYVMPFDLIRRAEPDENGTIVHVVEVGQTAWAIAARYGVDLQTLITLNHLGDDPVLWPGERLLIQLGEGQSAPPVPDEPHTYTVQPGESLWTIAARSHQSVDDLRAWNDLSAEDVILPGAVLLIAPPPTATEPPTATPTLAPSPTPSLLPVPSPWLTTATPAPTQSPPAVEVALRPPESDQAATAMPDELLAERAPRAPETMQRFLLLLGLLGVGFVVAAGGVIAWVRRKIRRS